MVEEGYSYLLSSLIPQLYTKGKKRVYLEGWVGSGVWGQSEYSDRVKKKSTPHFELSPSSPATQVVA
jgi:hypothetical protein